MATSMSVQPECWDSKEKHSIFQYEFENFCDRALVKPDMIPILVQISVGQWQVLSWDNKISSHDAYQN